MTIFDAGVIGISLAIAGGLYAYLLNERRKLHHARKHAEPAE